MGKAVILVGSQWGDEGKGKLVDWISAHSHAVIRFQGGNNAGHTLCWNDSEKIVLHLVPSGILQPHVQCLIGNGVVLSLPALLHEIEVLKTIKVDITGRLWISPYCPLILPSHVYLDAALDSQLESPVKIGTTGRGIGPAYEDKVSRCAVRVGDLRNPRLLAEKCHYLVARHNLHMANLGLVPVKAENIIVELLEIAPSIIPFLSDVGDLLSDWRYKVDGHLLFEGAQGTFLDVDHGTYPYVTSSNCLSGQAAVGSGVGPNFFTDVLGIVKSYCTRVGFGPFPTEQVNSIGDKLHEIGAEIGATTGRSRRCGWLDLPLLKRCVQLNGLTGLCVTKIDVLDTFPSILVCVAYENQKTGEQFAKAPLFDGESEFHYKPIYREFTGWMSSTRGMKQWDDLPQGAREYLSFITEETGVPVVAVATGPDRDDLIVCQDIFSIE